MRRRFVASILALVWLGAVGVSPAAAAGEWTQLGFGPAHNGFQRNETLLGPGSIGAVHQLWLQRMNVLWGSPAVVGNKLYVGLAIRSTDPNATSGRLVVRNARTGNLLWRRALDRPGDLSYPAVVNGIVYITSQYWNSDETGGTLYAFDATTGRLLWKKTGTAVFSSPTVADGMVLVAGGTVDSTVWAYDAVTGALRWKASQPAAFHVMTTTAPTVAGGRVFLDVNNGSGTGGVFALDEQTGALLWRTSLPDGYVESHLMVGNGLVIAPATQVGAYAFDSATGALRWSYTPENVDGSTWGAIASGTVYLTYDGTIPSGHRGDIEAALDLSNGSVRWTHVLPSPNVGIWGSPTIANGLVYVVGGFLDQIAVLRPATGATVRTITIPAGGALATPVVSRGSMYATAADYGVYRFGLAP